MQQLTLMKLKLFCILLMLSIAPEIYSQSIHGFADSIRRKYHIPELAVAVVSADKVLELDVLGTKKINSKMAAEKNDRFRIGSNTKTVTGFIAGQLVKEGKLRWDTKFFELFPEMKPGSDPAYYDLTLLNLLSFRTRLPRYTYTDAKPVKEQFPGNEGEQRYQFMKWFFTQKPVATKSETNFSNLGYVAAGLMMEKVTGKSYKQLVTDLGSQLGIDFQFGPPNSTDTLQPWGHDSQLVPEAPGNNYKLEWLLAAGNINVSLPDYVKFIQLQLNGLSGKSTLLSADEFKFLHYGLSNFAVGWFQEVNKQGERYSHHTGNPGTFLSEVYVFGDKDRGYILFANVQSDEASEGLSLIYNEMKKRYGK